MRESEKSALEQLRALSEVLGVMRRSPGELQPVLDAVIENAIRLCSAENGTILRVDAGVAYWLATAGPDIGDAVGPVAEQIARDRSTVAGRVLLTKDTVQIVDALKDPEYGEEWSRSFDESRTVGLTLLGVPLLRAGEVSGVIVLRRSRVEAFDPDEIRLVETFADQAAIAIENVRLFNETKEALSRQTAVSEVLQSIGRTAFDLDTVLATVLENAMRLCGSDFAALWQREGDHFRMWVSRTGSAEFDRIAAESPPSIQGGGVTARVTLTKRVVHIHDVLVDPDYSHKDHAKVGGYRTLLGVPLVRDDEVIAVLALARSAVRDYAPGEIELVRTFADQAAIAIENVRLFNETKEALERQTAISAVLATISRSAFDLRAILDTVVQNAVRLCGARGGLIFRRDGDVYRFAAVHGSTPEFAKYFEEGHFPPIRPGRGTLTGRVVVSKQPEHVLDLAADPEYAFGEVNKMEGTRTSLGVPLLHQGEPIGAMSLWRNEVRAFSDAEIELVQTFADQAAIAIENVRLFNETKEALEQQTATANVLDVISRSAFDIAPVFQTIADSSLALCRADHAVVWQRDGDEWFYDATAGDWAPSAPSRLKRRTWQPAGPSTIERAIESRRAVHLPDVLEDPQLRPESGTTETRTRLAVPILKDGEPIGAIQLGRRQMEPFSEREITLVESFATQAAIAMENVRLFNETKEALEQQTATAEVLQAIGGSALDLAGVLSTVISHATRLAGAENGFIYRAAGDVLHMVAAIGEKAEIMREWQSEHPIQTLDIGSATGRAFVERRSVHIPDVLADDTYTYVEAQQLGDFRTLLAVPLMREGQALGVIAMWRTAVRPFSDEQIGLVGSFAAQAVIAIENARLFNETQEALERQTATSDVLRVISQSTFDIQPVLDAVVQTAGRLARADAVWMRRVEAGELILYGPRGVGAHWGSTPETTDILDEHVREAEARGQSRGLGSSGRGRQDRSAIMGLVQSEGRTIHIEDLRARDDLRGSGTALAVGSRTVLAVPLLRQGSPVGLMILARTHVEPFSEQEIRLVETFADQATIAIENAQLFNEIQEKSKQLEIAGRHKSEFLANMSHELRTPLNAIIGFSEVLLQGMFGTLNNKQREYQEDVLSSGRHLLTLINDILDLSKIEAGRVELELGEFSLPAALENGITMIRERALKHDIRVELDVAGVDRILADERKVKQVVFNLLSNAVKFTPDGGRVDVRAARDDGEVRVAVRDTGIGIDEADRERIFEEFQQASRDPERSREGTGLGLALSKRYVELHGGRIWVDSEVGRGSTFTFALPLLPAKKEG